MFYSLVKSFVKFGLQWYVSDLRTEQLELIQEKIPSLIVANHPNSFFDALLIAVHHPGEIRFLTRGDLFERPLHNWLLRSLFMLPIYKKNDADDVAVRNAFTYEECARLLKEGKHILIFPEGRSHNQYSLHKFMPEGCDRLMEMCYKKSVALQIQPFALSYSSFSFVPKAVKIKALPKVDPTDFIEDHVVQTTAVLQKVREELTANLSVQPLVPKENPADLQKFLWIPAKIGYYTQFWYYRLWRDFIRKKTEGTIFFDSLLFGSLLFSYPLAVLFFSFLIGGFFGFMWGLFVFLFLPFTSYCMVKAQRIKTEENVDTVRKNYFESKEKQID